jgi:hypothetical protein
MYEYLAPATVRRTFTESNLALINTDADRLNKAAWVLPQAQGETAGRYSSPTVLDSNLAALAAALAEGKRIEPSYGSPAANVPVTPAIGVVSSESYAAGYFLNAGTSKAKALQAGDDLDWLLASYVQDRSHASAADWLN